MTDFIIHFFICNLLISGMIGILFLCKKEQPFRLLFFFLNSILTVSDSPYNIGKPAVSISVHFRL